MTLPAAEGASPAIAQWFALKAQHPQALLFFRMGDFYELFFADAEAAAPALDIALTSRGQHGGEPIPMCGVPCAAAGLYLSRLVRRGFRVAIAEQTERPRPGQRGPLERAVVRLVTPGTLTEDDLLEAGRPSLLLALATAPARGRAGRGGPGVAVGAAWIDISTGLFETAALPPGEPSLAELLGRLDPAEILAPADLPLGEHAGRRAPPLAFPAPAAARERLAAQFAVASLDAFGSFSDEEAVAAGLALDYVQRTQAGRMPRLGRPRPEPPASRLGIDAATRASLELLTARDGGATHTLLAAIDRTQTAAGGRLLADWITSPLTALGAITARQQGWLRLAAPDAPSGAMRDALRGLPDLARALARLSLGRGLPRDLACARDTLARAAEVGRLLDALASPPALLGELRQAASGALPALGERLAAALADVLPARFEEGGVIAPGFDPALDRERELRDDGRRLIAGLQAEYAQAFGVASLKIRHHAQLGYVIEMSAAAARGLAGERRLILRQGTASIARFTTDRLAGLDAALGEALGRAAAREAELVAGLTEAVLAEPALPELAAALARLDVLLGAAALAGEGGTGASWCAPELAEDDSFLLTACRHPVVEAALPPARPFTPNGCDLSPERRLMLLTGPNMAGKSTFLRQTALAVVLAQAGLPVPAARARIGIVDRLFSRVGAADELARGRSTFMVEMTETAAILNLAGPRSLVVVDEIGRGTATLDGLAIAWAVLEALHSGLRCRTLFATHFHELADLGASLPRLRAHTMKVREWKGEVIFQHEVVPGAARRSWGVHVARLAGVPEPVVARAARLLASLEREHARSAPKLPLFEALERAPEPVEGPGQEAPGQEERGPEAPRQEAPGPGVSGPGVTGPGVPGPGTAAPALDAASLAALEALRAIDPDALSPREALAALYHLRHQLGPSLAALHDVPVAGGGKPLD